MIVIIDYGMGNIGSIINMFKRIGYSDVIFTNNISTILKAEKIILPGVGSFDKGMNALEEKKLIPILEECALEKKKPFLGICLGMQLLTNGSEEGMLKGLGFIDAEVKRFKFDIDSKLKVPHMGWNYVRVNKDNPIISSSEDNRFYFVHSYYVECNEDKDILGVTNYGMDFVSAFQKDNIFGTQFHPEKSHKFGLELLSNFLNI